MTCVTSLRISKRSSLYFTPCPITIFRQASSSPGRTRLCLSQHMNHLLEQSNVASTYPACSGAGIATRLLILLCPTRTVNIISFREEKCGSRVAALSLRTSRQILKQGLAPGLMPKSYGPSGQELLVMAGASDAVLDRLPRHDQSRRRGSCPLPAFAEAGKDFLAKPLITGGDMTSTQIMQQPGIIARWSIPAPADGVRGAHPGPPFLSRAAQALLPPGLATASVTPAPRGSPCARYRASASAVGGCESRGGLVPGLGASCGSRGGCLRLPTPAADARPARDLPRPGSKRAPRRGCGAPERPHGSGRLGPATLGGQSGPPGSRLPTTASRGRPSREPHARPASGAWGLLRPTRLLGWGHTAHGSRPVLPIGARTVSPRMLPPLSLDRRRGPVGKSMTGHTRLKACYFASIYTVP
jgi:hypothetical protein